MKWNTLLIAFLCLGTAYAQDKPADCMVKNQETSDYKAYNLRGRVKEIKQNWWDAEEKFGEPAKTKLNGVDVETFDRSGRISKRNYDSNIGKDWSREYKYDNNRLVLIQEVDDGKKSSSVREYGTNGLIKSISDYDGNKLTGKSIYSYNGCKYTVKSYNGDGKLDATYIVEVDDNGNGFRTVSESKERNTETLETYNTKNQLIKYTYTRDGKPGFEYEYTYNDRGDELTQNDERFEYVYDKQGNWIKKITYRRGELAYIYEREIKYY